MGLDFSVLHDHGVDQILDPPDLFVRHRLLVREIESEAPGLDQRAFLGHMGPEHLAQRLMQEMGGRVMRAGRRAVRMVHVELDLVADFQRALLHHAVMQEQPMQLLLRVADREFRAARAVTACRGRRPGRRIRHKTGSD